MTPKLCPYCPAQNPQEARFCIGCGKPLPEPTEWSRSGRLTYGKGPQEEPDRGRWKPSFWLLIALVAYGSFVAFQSAQKHIAFDPAKARHPPPADWDDPQKQAERDLNACREADLKTRAELSALIQQKQALEAELDGVNGQPGLRAYKQWYEKNWAQINVNDKAIQSFDAKYGKGAFARTVAALEKENPQ
jgi:hypothetical protein